jgi:TetR/AcrR family transcriptional regulator
MKIHTRKVPRRSPAKEAIRDAAAELFAEKGFAATSTREICQRAGITKPVLYYHFGNKEQLYEELVLDTFSEYKKEVRRAALRGRSTHGKLVEALSAMFSYARHRHNYWRVGFRMVFAPEKESPTINYVEMSQADEQLLAEIVREGIRQGQMRGRALQIARSIAGMAITSIMSYLVTGKPPLDRSTARGIVDLLMEGCGGKPTAR